MADALTIEEKRQVIYSSLLRYAPEVAPLRQRALDRVVLGALLDSSADDPLRIGRIEDNLRAGGTPLRIRADLIQESIDRQRELGKIDHALKRGRHAYFLTPRGRGEIEDVIGEREMLFENVLSRALAHTEVSIRPEVARRVFTDFLFECFARSGRLLAQHVISRNDGGELAKRVDARSAFVEASRNQGLNEHQLETLEARCFSFLTSTDSLDERLRFELAQGYYFTQLLGVDTAAFNPLAEHAFSGAVFYLDTNVVIGALFLPDPDQQEFQEVIALAKRLGLQLKVTRATIAELRTVTMDRMGEIVAIASKLPEALTNRSADSLLNAFIRAKDENAALTPEGFLGSLDKLDERLVNLGLEIDERTQDELIANRATAQEEAVVSQCAEESRGWGKSLHVARHDAAHLLLIRDERKQNPKTWFLTRDRSLFVACERLYGADISLCFSQIGLLQSISPFVETPSEERSFAEVFARLMREQFKPIGIVFEVSELAIVAEFHDDVMATPADQLVRAFDYVKTRTLQGHPYREKDIPRVSLELKKFLATDRDAQIKALQAEHERLRRESEAERSKREAVEAERNDANVRAQSLEHEIGSLNQTIGTLTGSIDDFNTRLQGTESLLELQRALADRTRRRERAILAVAAFATAIAGWAEVDLLASLFSPLGLGSPISQGVVQFALRVIIALMAAIPAFRLIKYENDSRETKIAATTVVISVILVLSHLLTREEIGDFADLLGVAGFGAVLALVAWRIEHDLEDPTPENRK